MNLTSQSGLAAEAEEARERPASMPVPRWDRNSTVESTCFGKSWKHLRRRARGDRSDSRRCKGTAEPIEWREWWRSWRAPGKADERA